MKHLRAFWRWLVELFALPAPPSAPYSGSIRTTVSFDVVNDLVRLTMNNHGRIELWIDLTPGEARGIATSLQKAAAAIHAPAHDAPELQP